MALFQLDFTRFITVYIGQGIFFGFYLFIAYNILKREKRQLNYVFSCFYLFIVLALLINFIYAPIPYPEIQRILNTLTNFFVFFGLIFLPLFDLLLLKEEKLKTKYIILIIIIYALLLSTIMFTNPLSVRIGPSTNWRPVWSMTYFMHLIILKSLMIVIPTFTLQILLYRKFQIKELKKRWLYFNIGIAGIFSFSYGIMIANFLNDPLFRIIISIYSLSILAWGYLTYYGVGKQIGK
ncbi:MAG: hypothetical protein ACFFCV_13060 [Promethearchaeota archaeon]